MAAGVLRAGLLVALLPGLAGVAPPPGRPPAPPEAPFDGAFRDAQMAVSSRAALALSRGAARLAQSDPIRADAIGARQLAGEALGRAEALDAAARAEDAPDPDRLAAAADAIATARAQLAAADRVLAVRAPDYALLAGIAPVDRAAAQALLGPGEALLLIQPTDDGTYLFALTATDRGWARAAPTARSLAEDVRALRLGLDPAGLVRAGEDAAPSAQRMRGVSFPRGLAWRLYQALWQPLAPLLARATTVYVIAGGALGGLPLAVLPTRPPRGADDDPAALRSTAWLVRRVALVTLPSVASLRALRSGRDDPAPRPFTGFGDPLLPPGALPPLPGTRDELVRLAAVMHAPPASVVTGAAATEAAVKAAPLADIRVVAFATHGLLAGERIDEPALVLTPPATPNGADDGLLTASEAAGLKLSADWVILSACNTAADDGEAQGEGLSGLARGFFAAGARALLVSHWRVRDDVAADLTTRTLDGYMRHPADGRARALQRAMLAMIDDRRHPERAQPAYWAPFVIAGEGR